MRASKVLAALAGAALMISGAAQGQAPSPTPRAPDRVQMSISSTLFQGMPEALVIALMKPFESLLIAQTGMGGDILPAGNGEAVAQQLMDGKIHVGVVEGIEYAWLK